MNKVLEKRYHLLISLLCAISVFGLSMVFQKMAYLPNNGFLGYWTGVVITAVVWLSGSIFLFMAMHKNRAKLLNVLGYILSISLLISGLLWVVFVVSMGLG